MRVCVDGTVNLRCAIHKRFAYCLKFVGFCANMNRTEGVFCSPQVHRKLINCALLMCRMQAAQCVSGALVYTTLNANMMQTLRSDQRKQIRTTSITCNIWSTIRREPNLVVFFMNTKSIHDNVWTTVFSVCQGGWVKLSVNDRQLPPK